MLSESEALIMKKSKIEVVNSTTNKTEAKYFASIKVCDCGSCLYVKFSKSKRKGKFYTKRISKNEYVDTRTGEVFEYTKEYEKSSASFDKIKRIIIRNFKGTKNELFITLKYDIDLFDSTQIKDDFKAFWRKFRKVYPHCEYVRIAEPNDIGAWHIHFLVKDTVNDYLFIPVERLSKLWGNGNVFVERIEYAYGLANYFVPSFKKSATKKARKKAQRLKYYPKHFRNFTYSNGIVIPPTVDTDYEEYSELTKDRELHYATADKNIFEVLPDGKKKWLNTTRFEEYVDKYLKTSDFKPELSGKRKEVDE